MIKELIKKSWIFIIILGSITLGVAFISGAFNFDNATIINKETTYILGYQWNYYTIDLRSYLNNILNSIQINNIPNWFANTPQQPIWPEYNNDAINNILVTIQYIAKGSVLTINWLIYIISNVLLTPIKLLLYPARIIMVLLGINGSDESFTYAFNLLWNFNIPYIPY